MKRAVKWTSTASTVDHLEKGRSTSLKKAGRRRPVNTYSKRMGKFLQAINALQGMDRYWKEVFKLVHIKNVVKKVQHIFTILIAYSGIIFSWSSCFQYVLLVFPFPFFCLLLNLPPWHFIVSKNGSTRFYCHVVTLVVTVRESLSPFFSVYSLLQHKKTHKERGAFC